MKLTQWRVQLWLEDLAKRTHGEYTIKYEQDRELHSVKNRHGEVRIRKIHSADCWRREFEEITTLKRFIEILNEIDK